MNLDDYPPELHHTGILSHSATGINTTASKPDLLLISHSAREIVSMAEGIVAVAMTDYPKALGFIGLALMGAYQLGCERTLKDLGLMKGQTSA